MTCMCGVGITCKYHLYKSKLDKMKKELVS